MILSFPQCSGRYLRASISRDAERQRHYRDAHYFAEIVASTVRAVPGGRQCGGVIGCRNDIVLIEQIAHEDDAGAAFVQPEQLAAGAGETAT
jgi:hypothetical protein